MIPVELRPHCPLSALAEPTFWAMMGAVAGCLKRHGLLSEADEFRRRAMTLTQDDADTTDLLALAVEYIEVD